MTATSPPLAGVIGWPVAHSQSPALHGHWLLRYGINGFYVPLAVRQQDFEEALRLLPKLGFRGVNITIPYKEMALALVDNVSDRASLIGAINTITFRESGAISGDNTDGYGFLENIKSSIPGWDASAGPALVIGAGGAARSVVSSLLSAGAPEIRLANRTRQRADILAERFGARVTATDWNRISDAVDGAALIVNATALGMEGRPPLPISLDSASAEAIVADIVYVPLETPLLRRARDRNLRTVDGLGMLLYQAVPGFESWFGRRPEVDDELRAAVMAA